MTNIGAVDSQTVRRRGAIATEFQRPQHSRTPSNTQSRTISLLLWCSLALQIGSVAYYAWYVYANGYLPAPFIYNKLDTFMDLYNPLWWSGEEGKYGEWRTVYPPLNFVFLDVVRRIFFEGQTIVSPMEFRYVSLVPAFILSGLYVAGPLLVANTRHWSVLYPNRVLIATIAVLSQPFLFSMERGNLIILSLLLLPSALAGKRSFFRVISVALLINLKPYFVLLLLGYVIAREWECLVAAVAAAGVIFLFGGLACDPDFPLLLANLFSFSRDAPLSGREVLALPSSLSAFSHVASLTARTSTNADTQVGDLIILSEALEVLKAATLTAVIGALFAAGRRLREPQIMAGLIIIVVNMSVSVGGYSQIYYLACVPALFTMRLRWLLLGIIFAIYLPWDVVVLRTEDLGPTYSFITDSLVNLDWQLGLGSLLRPLLNFALLLSIGIECVVHATPVNFSPINRT
jgi:hypothetical protein